MKTKLMGIALLSTAALLGNAVAQAELPWTYGELGYYRANGNENSETDAYDITGSIGFANIWHGSLSYTDGENDSNTGPDTDFDGYRLIVGAHPQLTPNTQLVTDLTYFDYEADSSGPEVDGYGLGLGLRHGLTDKVELMAKIWYTEGTVDTGTDLDYNDTTFEAGARYNWTPNLSTGITVNLAGGSASNTFIAGGDGARFDVRWSFPGDFF